MSLGSCASVKYRDASDRLLVWELGGEKPVDARNRLDEAALQKWMLQHVAGYGGSLPAITQFKGGQSNPTYRLETQDGNYVLRRKPFGKLLRSAHAVEREFRVIAALHAAGFPVPKPYALCEDATVIGSALILGAGQISIFEKRHAPRTVSITAADPSTAASSSAPK